MEATAIINPDTGSLSTSKNEIKKVSVQYCKNTLKNNEPDDKFKEEIERKKNIVKDFLCNKGETS